MNIHGPTNGHSYGRTDMAHSIERAKLSSRSTVAGGNEAGASEASSLPVIETATLFAQLRDLPEIREGVLPPVVSKLRSGAYHTPESAQRLADAILKQAELD